MSTSLVMLAKRSNAGIRLEDLNGFFQFASQAGDYASDEYDAVYRWSFHRLETLIRREAVAKGVPVEEVPPCYTSQSCHNCGAIQDRNGDMYHCRRCGYKVHADANAAMNIRDWYGMFCPLEI